MFKQVENAVRYQINRNRLQCWMG